MIVYLNADDNRITYNKKQYLLRADERLGLGVFKDIQECRGTPEYVLNIEPYGFKKGSKWTGVWEIDVIFDRAALNGSNYAASNTVFQAVSYVPNSVRGFEDKIQVLFQACDPELHRRMCKPKFDFVMCGSAGNPYHNKRGACYVVLKDTFTYEDFGKGIDPKGYVYSISQARVQFIRSADTILADGEIAQRFFECLAIGPVLTNRVDDLKLTGLVEDEHYMAYGDDDEMVAKMHLLIDNEGLRNKIADNGRRAALNAHTYEHRLVSILNRIGEDCGLSTLKL